MANARLGWFSPLGVAASIRASAGRVGSSAFRFGVALGGLVFGLIASAFRHAPIRGGRWASSFFRLPLRKFRWAGWPSGSLLPLFGARRFGVAAGRVGSSAFRFGDCPRRVGLRAHRFHFSACTASEIPLGGLAFGLTASAFRPAPLRRLPLGGWPSDSPLPLFGTHRFGNCPRRVGLRAHRFRFSACADPHRCTAEARTDGAHRHDNCFTSKHLSQHVNLPHRTP